MDGDPNKNSTITISKHFSMLNESPMSCFTNPNSNFLTNGWFFNILGVQENPKIAKYRIISHSEPWEAYNESKQTCMKWIIAILQIFACISTQKHKFENNIQKKLKWGLGPTFECNYSSLKAPNQWKTTLEAVGRSEAL